MAEMEKTDLGAEELDAVSGGFAAATVTTDERMDLKKFQHECDQDDKDYKLKDKELGIEKYKAVTDRKKAIIDSGMSVFKIVGDGISAAGK